MVSKEGKMVKRMGEKQEQKDKTVSKGRKKGQ